MKTLDRVLSVLLILGGIGHTAGTLIGYKDKPELMLWSLCTSLFVFLLGAVNFLRASRAGDRSLGWITVIFNLAWFVACLEFGHIIGKMGDFRVIGFSVITLVLSGLSVRSMGARERSEIA